jgi:hypothetical protein
LSAIFGFLIHAHPICIVQLKDEEGVQALAGCERHATLVVELEVGTP